MPMMCLRGDSRAHTIRTLSSAHRGIVTAEVYFEISWSRWRRELCREASEQSAARGAFDAVHGSIDAIEDFGGRRGGERAEEIIEKVIQRN
uniref:Uncharacterized protein n=1 Tax=Ditylenchus dipsaci TaxID=166011 RepID=A0A915DV30_9BILA